MVIISENVDALECVFKVAFCGGASSPTPWAAVSSQEHPSSLVLDEQHLDKAPLELIRNSLSSRFSKNSLAKLLFGLE